MCAQSCSNPCKGSECSRWKGRRPRGVAAGHVLPWSQHTLRTSDRHPGCGLFPRSVKHCIPQVSPTYPTFNLRKCFIFDIPTRKACQRRRVSPIPSHISFRALLLSGHYPRHPRASFRPQCVLRGNVAQTPYLSSLFLNPSVHCHIFTCIARRHPFGLQRHTARSLIRKARGAATQRPFG